MSRIKNIALTAAVVLLPGLAAADKLAVFPATGTGLAPEQLEAVAKVVSTALTRQQHQVFLPAASEAARTEAGSAPAGAVKLGADGYVTLDATRLDKQIIVSAVRYNAAGAQVHAADIAVAGLDELPNAADRLAAALMGQTTVKEVQGMTNVVAKDSETARQVKKARHLALMRLGFAGGFSATTDVDVDNLVLATVGGRYENDDTWVDFLAGLALPGGEDGGYSYGGLLAAAGAGLYLGEGTTAPYVGAGVEARLGGGENDAAIGLLPYGNLGVMFMRDASTRVILEARIAQNLLGMDTKPDWYDDYSYDYETGESTRIERDDPKIYPTEVGVAFGVAF